MKQTPLTVFVADDHPIFRRGLCEVIKDEAHLRLLDQASTGEAAFKRITELKPNIAILDINMPKMSGLEVARLLEEEQPETKIIVLTMHEDEDLFNASIDAGVLAYLLKENAIEDLVKTINAVNQGKTFITPSISDYLVRRAHNHRELKTAKPGLELLTTTEKRVLKLIAKDNTSKQIADLLKNSVRTVETHRQNISAKLNLTGSHSLLKFAFENKSKL